MTSEETARDLVLEVSDYLLKDNADALASAIASALAAARADAEQRFRYLLWVGHRHNGRYGDDGEMQCQRCAPVWDYKRMPLEDLVAAAIASVSHQARAEEREACARVVERVSEDAEHSAKRCQHVMELAEASEYHRQALLTRAVVAAIRARAAGEGEAK